MENAMNNTINNLSNTLVDASKHNAKGGAKAIATQKPCDDKATADKVSLSGSVVLQKLEKNMATSSEVDMNKVNQIKEALNNGEYKVDADLIAKNFFDIEQALGQI
jgi:negative regulator of flagellin synthesis FlgM